MIESLFYRHLSNYFGPGRIPAAEKTVMTHKTRVLSSRSLVRNEKDH